MTAIRSGTPETSEWSPFHLDYLVDFLPGVPKSPDAPPAARGFEDDAHGFLLAQLSDFEGLARTIPPEREQYRYASGKWSIRELVGHLCDTERILVWRSLAAARGDTTNIEPFDENRYVAAAGHDLVPIVRLADELVAVRRSSLALYESLDAASWSRRGLSNGHPVSARAWAFAVGCHAELHLRTLRTRYLP